LRRRRPRPWRSSRRRPRASHEAQATPAWGSHRLAGRAPAPGPGHGRNGGGPAAAPRARLGRTGGARAGTRPRPGRSGADGRPAGGRYLCSRP
jgi:hypothetical protein